MKIADIHAHIFPEKLAEKASHSIGSFYGVSIEREADMPRLCAEDKLAGITRCVVSNSATNASQVQNANTFLAEAVRGHDGYLAFGTIYPGMDGFEEELDRMLELGLRGIKIHPDFQKLAIDDESAIDTSGAEAVTLIVTEEWLRSSHGARVLWCCYAIAACQQQQLVLGWRRSYSSRARMNSTSLIGVSPGCSAAKCSR